MKKQTFKKLTALLLVLALIPVFSLFTLAANDIVSGTWGNLTRELNKTTGALNSTYAVLALVAIFGFAFVAKKKETTK